MEEISVTISHEEIIKLKRVEMVETYILNRLRKAGIPVKGFLLFAGLEQGTLTREETPWSGNIFFTWRCGNGDEYDE